MRQCFLFSFIFLSACASSDKTVPTAVGVDIQKFMGPWYVLAGRFTFLEKDVNNALEVYTWNADENRIDIGFTFNKGSFEGPIKSIPQKGWIQDKVNNSTWKISPIWPLKFNYLIVDVAEDYSWTAIGVPDQKYLWIMARDWNNPEPVVAEAVRRLKLKGYKADELVIVPHKWPRTESKTN